METEGLNVTHKNNQETIQKHTSDEIQVEICFLLGSL